MTDETDGITGIMPRAGQHLDPGGRQWLAAIVDSSTDAIIGKTLDGIITDWNTAAAELYGYAAAEIIGRSIADLIPADHEGELESILSRLRRGERVEHFDTQRVRKDGSVLDVSVSVSPVRSPDGRIVGAASVARDMTSRNQAEAERRDAIDRLHRSERLETVGQLAGGLAHDFNNMLGLILGYGQMLAENPGLDGDSRSDAGKIVLAGQRASEIVKELMTFSRGRESIPAPLSLDSVLGEFSSLLGTAAGGNVRLKDHIPPGLPAMLADRGRLEHVLLNLVVNARDAMPRGGTLTIAAGAEQLGGADGVQPGTYLRLSVRDTGCGMPPEVIRRATEAFYTTKPVGQGTGLGLSSVHGIVTEAGGTMRIDSEPGSGTAVHLYFPAAAAAGAGPSSAPAETARAHGETILVVDDEPDFVALIARQLRRHGYRTLEADNAADALALVAAGDCQLLLTDHVMTDTTGAQLADRVREVRPDMPALYMTGAAASGQPSGDPAGQALIRKPFTEPDLLAGIRNAVAARG